MNLGSKLSDFWHRFQAELFPALSEEDGRVLGTHRPFFGDLHFVVVEGFLGAKGRCPCRPPEDPQRPGAGLLVNALWDLPTTGHLIDRLRPAPALRRLCGRLRVGTISSTVTFSRAFAEFAEGRLAEDARGAGGRCAWRGAHRSCVAGHLGSRRKIVV